MGELAQLVRVLAVRDDSCSGRKAILPQPVVSRGNRPYPHYTTTTAAE